MDSDQIRKTGKYLKGNAQNSFDLKAAILDEAKWNKLVSLVDHHQPLMDAIVAAQSDTYTAADAFSVHKELRQIYGPRGEHSDALLYESLKKRCRMRQCMNEFMWTQWRD